MKIRKHRKAQSITLVQLAELCNISPSFLSQLERDQANPSVTTLYAIAEALGESIAAFFAEPALNEDSREPSPIKAPAKVVRAEKRKTLIYPDTGIHIELLTPDLTGAIQMMWIVMPPGTDSGETPFVHEGEECGIILQGQIETWVGEERFILGPGDSIYHDSTIPHHNRVIGDTEVIMVVAKTPPSI
jgi:transcriptional regulator with XRE-family HTH domain